MTPGQLQSLRQQLPGFAEGAQPSPELQAFCREYGLDFAAHLPHVEHRAGCIDSGDYILAVHCWRQPGASANLLLLHGYFDHTGLFSKLIAWGLSRGCNVLMFDLPGHGLSSGAPAVIDDFGHYSRAIDDVLRTVSLPPLPFWVMAQSTGGSALVDYARKYTWPFAAKVLLAPLVRPTNWRRVRLAQAVARHFVASVPRTFSSNSSDREFLAFIQRDPLQSREISLRWVGALRRWLRHLPLRDLHVGPALIVQGDADATVDWRYNVAVLQTLFPGSQVEYLPGAGHQLANESAAIRQDYLLRVECWLKQHGITLGNSQE